MKKNIHKYASLLVLIVMLSCNGQQKTEAQKESKPPAQQEANTEEFDPYFIESKTITSPYGPNSITRNIIQDKIVIFSCKMNVRI